MRVLRKNTIMDDFMNSVLEQFDAITDMLARQCSSDMTYMDICRMLDVDPAVLDECLMEELGMDGNSIIEVFRRHLPVVFL